MVVSARTSEQLELLKILDIVSGYAKGENGKARCKSILTLDSLDRLQSELRQTKDIVEMLSEGEVFDLFPYEDVSDDLYMLSKNGYVLDVEAVHRILDVLRNYDGFIKHFTKGRPATYPYIYQLGYIDGYTSDPIDKILKVFDEEGNVKPDASPELIQIHKKIRSTEREAEKRFGELLLQYKKANLLSDTEETLRSGRKVLVLPVEHKRKIPGVIHDQSATGKTVYMEPQELMILNNEVLSLQNDLRAEIYKVLKTLSEDLRGDGDMIKMSYEKLGLIDAVRAKGVFSHKIGGVLPELDDKCSLSLKGVKHPTLLLQELSGGAKTIPFDLTLKGDNRMLLISGPNAGGKSVTLKAVGLVHLMLYHGLLVPVEEKSKMSIFSNIFTDIGDQQSIDEGLSTYSSHLTNLKVILDEADDKSLVLLDEIGSGTDPKLGGAIAEGILRGLIAKKCIGIVTTHYSELKIFAFRQEGIVNGAMLFDKENLQPTYKLKVGKPGSSYAFEVANKVGLDHRAIRYARKKVGKKENQVEDLLVDLQEGKAILDEQLKWLDDERTRLDKLIKNYETLSKEFQVKRKKLQIRAKEIELKNTNLESTALQDVINKLEKEKILDKVRKKKKDALQKRAQESKQIVELKKEILAEKRADEVITAGDYVKMIDGDMSGEVLSVKGDNAKILFGLMQMEVPLADVTLANAHLEFNRNKNINVKGVAFEANFSPKLDIRGYKMSDAEATLDVFFDKAILNNVRTLEIVHGKGKGALRSLVISKMKEYKDFQSYYHPDDDRGGDGVTFIRM